MQAAVEHAISSMRTRYDEPITLHALAAEVFVSPFHFSRVFATTVGVTPGRFLTAVRLFEAKRRLLSSDDTIADIVCAVGYSSVGTFTSRFTKAVGLTPGQYRDPVVAASLLAVSADDTQVPTSAVLDHARTAGPGPASIAVGVRVPDLAAAPDRTVVAAFEGPVPQGAPLALATVGPEETGAVLRGLPVGSWTVLAVSIDADGHALSARTDVEVRRGEEALPPVELDLAAPRATDAPVAVSLLAPLQGLPGPTVGVRHLRAVA